MWTRVGLALAAAALAACAAPATPELTPERRAAMEDSVRAMLDEYAALVAAGDWAAVSELYADDPRFHWVEQGEVRYSSVQGVRDAIGSLARMLEAQGFSGAEIRFDDARVIAVAPGAAHVTTAFEQRFTRTEGEPFAFEGAITSLVVHDEEGWRFLAGHTSNPSPPAAEDAVPDTAAGGERP